MKDLGSGTVTDVVFAGNLRIGKVESGSNYYYHLDRLGSVRLVTRDQSTQPFTGKYQPFGTPYATSGSELFRFTGKQLDQSTGLYYYGYRYYDDQVGAFVSQDIARGQGFRPQSINRYPYALNNPTRYVDPTGAQSDDNIIVTQWGMLSLIGKVLKASSSSSSSGNAKSPDPFSNQDNLQITKPSKYSQFKGRVNETKWAAFHEKRDWSYFNRTWGIPRNGQSQPYYDKESFYTQTIALSIVNMLDEKAFL